MDWETLLIEMASSLVITVFAYLFVPVMCIVFGKRYNAKTLKRINIINCVVIWLLFRLFEAAVLGETSSGVAVILWGGVGHWLLRKYCIKEETLGEETGPQFSDVKEDTTVANQTVSPSYTTSSAVQPSKITASKYCSRCGNAIDPMSKKCTGCGKQYFKGVSWQIVAIIVLSFCLVFSAVLNFIFFNKSQEANNHYSIPDEYSDAYDFWIDNYDKVNSIDNAVVFVEDDNTDWYHKYECSRFIGNSYWVFNVEYAEYSGYTPCPYCFH